MFEFLLYEVVVKDKFLDYKLCDDLFVYDDICKEDFCIDEIGGCSNFIYIILGFDERIFRVFVNFNIIIIDVWSIEDGDLKCVIVVDDIV